MADELSKIRYPRRRLIRGILRPAISAAFATLANVEISGRENLPKSGPLIVVGNHFSFLDPVAMIRVLPWPPEYIGGHRNPSAPVWTGFFSHLWGYYPVFRGTGSRFALLAAERVIRQGGILGIFPEAGNWATVLRPARPGTAYLAVRTGAPILPVGFDGLTEVFSALKEGRRARVTMRIGRPFGPFKATGRGRERRRQLEEIGHEIMQHIAELIPPERRGHYSDDPAIREAAKGTEIYPWDSRTEEEFTGGELL